MAEMEYIKYSDFVESLSRTENPASSDKVVVCNPTNGPRAVPSNARAMANEQTEGKVKVYGTNGAGYFDIEKIFGNFAGKFDPTRTVRNPYKVGDVVMYNGTLYRFNKEHYGSFVASRADLFDVENVVHSIYEDSTAYDNILEKISVEKSCIVTNVDVGAVVDLTPVYNGSFLHCVIECKKGDSFKLFGLGGSASLLWCFVDNENKLVCAAGQSFDTGADGIIEVAPCDGKLIYNAIRTPEHGTYPKLLERKNLTTYLDSFKNQSFVKKDVIESSTQHVLIDTGKSVGDSVSFDFVQNVSYQNLILDCAKGDYFEITGVGGSIGRLWCFVDDENKVVSVSAANATSGDSKIVLFATCDGKLIINAAISPANGPSASCLVNCSNQELYDISKEHFEKEIENCEFFKNILEDDVKDSYINTSVGVGNVVNFTPVSNTSFHHVVVECQKNDCFEIIGRGGSNGRLWCFVDDENKVVTVSNADFNTGTTPLKVYAPCPGKFILNVFYTSPAGAKTYCKTLYNSQKYVDEKIDPINHVFKDISKSLIKDFVRINTALNVGDAVDLSYEAWSSFCCLVYDCAEGDEFLIKGTGGEVGRLYCFVDNENKVVAVSRANLLTDSEGVIVKAPADGKIICNFVKLPDSGIYAFFGVATPSQNLVDSVISKTESTFDSLFKFEIPEDDSKFEELATILANIDYSGDVMSQVYAGFDLLCANYSSLITRYDAATIAEMNYPRYANGISSGDPDYLHTPAYKTYLYKISNSNEAAGNTTRWKKKKLLIVSGIHGSEFKASVNCLALANHLCDNISKDLFALLSLFDVYIMPCVNGYGIVHDTRKNANGIDINRSFGTLNWTKNNDPSSSEYGGETPDTEFETLLVEKIFDYVEPDFFVDHHCAPSHSDNQFYTESPSIDVWKRSYKALTDVSSFLVRRLPEYFGTQYRLYRERVYGQALPYGLSHNPQSVLWAYERGCQSSTIEVYGYINFLDGVYNPIGTLGADYQMMCEYMLRSQICNFVHTVL